MININTETPLEDILSFVKSWLKLLSDGKLAEACAQIDEPFHNDVVWTPKLIMQVLNDTFILESRFYRYHPEGPIFTNPYELEEQTRELNDWLESGLDPGNDGVYYFGYSVPLNGEWSDLSALFEFRKRNGSYSVVLQDLHVM